LPSLPRDGYHPFVLAALRRSNNRVVRGDGVGLKSITRLLLSLLLYLSVGILESLLTRPEIPTRTCEAVLDACPAGVSDCLDCSLHSDGHQLLAALG
jgi:hypothetical protein